MNHCMNCGIKLSPDRPKYCSKKCNDSHYQRNHPESRRKTWRKYNASHLKEIARKALDNYHRNPEKYNDYRKKNHLQNNARTRAKYAMKKAGIPKVCIDCNSSEKIHVHHIDKNVFNNNLDNLAYLCTIHHGLRHQKINDHL